MMSIENGSSASPLAHEPSRRTVVAVFVALMVVMVAGSLDQTIVSTALPTIAGDLDDMSHLLWITTAYVLACTITMPIYGKLGDMVGRKSLFVGALLLFLVGSVMCGAADTMAVMIAGRAVAGLGDGGLMVLSQAIVADVVPARKRALYLNIMGVGWALPMLVGPLLGGLFTDVLGWRWCFWINIPLTLFAIVVSAALLPAYRKRGSLADFDIWGMAFIAAAVCTLTLATSWGGVEYDWNSPVIIGLLAATAILAALFALAESKAKQPLMPLFLFKNRNFVLTTVGGFIVLFATMAAMSYHLLPDCPWPQRYGGGLHGSAHEHRLFGCLAYFGRAHQQEWALQEAYGGELRDSHGWHSVHRNAYGRYLGGTCRAVSCHHGLRHGLELRGPGLDRSKRVLR